MHFGGGNPFGGMPGGMPGGRNKEVDTIKLYEVLDVEKSADEKTLKKAYRKSCLKHHPDKGGDEHFFKEVNAGTFRFVSFCLILFYFRCWIFPGSFDSL
ncbi:MAG: DnaJ family protein A protein 2 [Bacillariaceae sp.]|jgi:DnaJ family protein A protein 2